MEKLTPNMEALKDIFKPQFSLGNILILIFVAGGFYYVTPQQIESNTNTIQTHIEQAQRKFEDHQSQIDMNARRLGAIERSYVPESSLEEFVTKGDLDNLEKLMREIQAQQRQRLDYIIKRLDNDR